MDYLKGLNESQYEAVTTIQGPLMVLAGAGPENQSTYYAYCSSYTKWCDPFNIPH